MSYDRPEPGQCVQRVWKLKECFSILVLEIKKQTTTQEKKLPNQKQLKVLTFLYYKIMLS